jgi:hypothetical protein
VRRSVRGGPAAPFGAEDVQYLELWASGHIDVSDDTVWAAAPEAVQAVLAERFGWDAIRGPGPLTYREARLSLQLAAEERVGAPLRLATQLEQSRVDDAWAGFEVAARAAGAIGEDS